MFTEVMITNALSPLRTLEALRGLVVPGGTVAVMSSEQGSISRNTGDGYELYQETISLNSRPIPVIGDGLGVWSAYPGRDTFIGGGDDPCADSPGVRSRRSCLWPWCARWRS
jgi:hypothetical protein